MPNFESGEAAAKKNNNPQQEEELQFRNKMIGVKKNPDGTLDFSQAAHVIESPEGRARDILKISRKFDQYFGGSISIDKFGQDKIKDSEMVAMLGDRAFDLMPQLTKDGLIEQKDSEIIYKNLAQKLFPKINETEVVKNRANILLNIDILALVKGGSRGFDIKYLFGGTEFYDIIDKFEQNPNNQETADMLAHGIEGEFKRNAPDLLRYLKNQLFYLSRALNEDVFNKIENPHDIEKKEHEKSVRAHNSNMSQMAEAQFQLSILINNLEEKIKADAKSFKLSADDVLENIDDQSDDLGKRIIDNARSKDNGDLDKYKELQDISQSLRGRKLKEGQSPIEYLDDQIKFIEKQIIQSKDINEQSRLLATRQRYISTNEYIFKLTSQLRNARVSVGSPMQRLKSNLNLGNNINKLNLGNNINKWVKLGRFLKELANEYDKDKRDRSQKSIEYQAKFEKFTAKF